MIACSRCTARCSCWPWPAAAARGATLFAAGLGHAVHLSDYLELAWLTSSPGTVSGALGAGLESDEAVRGAACTYRSEHSGSDPVRVGSGG